MISKKLGRKSLVINGRYIRLFFSVLVYLLVSPLIFASNINHDLSLYMGIKYLHGDPPNIEQNKLTAREYLQVAAQAEDPIAYFFLAQTFDSTCFGKSAPCDYETWLGKAANGGNATGQLLYGLELSEMGEDKLLEAIKWVGSAADQADKGAKRQLDKLLLLAIDETADNEQRLERCTTLSPRLKKLNHALGLLIQQQCNLISTDDWLSKTIDQSEEGDTGASFLLGTIFFETVVLPDRALKYFNRSQEQISSSTNDTYLNHLIKTGEIDPGKEAQYLQEVLQIASQSRANDRISSLLDERAKIDNESRMENQVDWDSQRDRPMQRILRKAAGVALYSLAIGLDAAAQSYAAQSTNPNYNAFVSEYKKPSIGYNPNQSTNLFSSNNNTNHWKNTSIPPQQNSLVRFGNTCRCACVDGRQVSLCTSAVAVPAICTGVCPVSLPINQLPSVTPPPPGTDRCANRQVYNERTGRYETKTVCE